MKDKNEYRTVRLSISNIEFLDSISRKNDSYDMLVSKVISSAKPILLKEMGD